MNFGQGPQTFKIISNADLKDLMESGSDVEDRASCQDTVVTCTFDGNMKIIPLDDMFITHQYQLKHETRKDKDWISEWSYIEKMVVHWCITSNNQRHPMLARSDGEKGQAPMRHPQGRGHRDGIRHEV